MTLKSLNELVASNGWYANFGTGRLTLPSIPFSLAARPSLRLSVFFQAGSSAMASSSVVSVSTMVFGAVYASTWHYLSCQGTAAPALRGQRYKLPLGVSLNLVIPM